MRLFLKIFFLLLIAFSAKSQTPEPSGFPSPYNTSYYRIGWMQSDSGSIPAPRDTTLRPKYAGTEVFWQHAGVDTAKWIFTGLKWLKELKTGDALSLNPSNIVDQYLNGFGLFVNFNTDSIPQGSTNLYFNSRDTANLSHRIDTIGAKTFNISADQGLIDSVGVIQLGQKLGAVGDPAIVESIREIPIDNTKGYITMTSRKAHTNTSRYFVPWGDFITGDISSGTPAEINLSDAVSAGQVDMYIISDSTFLMNFIGATSTGVEIPEMTLYSNTGHFSFTNGQDIWTDHSPYVQFSHTVGIYDTLELPNIARKAVDTANLKAVVVDALGNIFKMSWPSTGSGAVPGNIGTGLNIYAPQIPGFRRLNILAPLVGDTTTVVNSLTLQADTLAGNQNLETQGAAARTYQPIGNYLTTIPSNIGSGFRIYTPQVPGFRTLFGSNIIIDSTTNTNALTLTSNAIDSIRRSKDSIYGYVASTKSLEYTDSISPWPDPTVIGDLINKTTFTPNDLGQWNTNGTGSLSVNLLTNQLVMTTTTNSFNNESDWVALGPSMLDHITITRQLVVNTAGTYADITIRGLNQGIVAGINTTTGTLSICNQPNSGCYTSGVTGPAIVLGHSYQLILDNEDSTCSLSAQDITTGGTIYTTSTAYTLGFQQQWNGGYVGILDYGGSIATSKWEVYSNEYKNTNWVIIGDSKTKEYLPACFACRFTPQVGKTVPPYSLWAGSSQTLAGIIPMMPEILRFNAHGYLDAMTPNDIRADTSYKNQLVVQSNLTKLVNAQLAGGARVVLTCFPEDSTAGGVGLTRWWNWLKATWTGVPNVFVLDCWDSLSTNNRLRAIYNSGDGIHPNQAGNNEIAALMLASGYFTIRDTISRHAPAGPNGTGDVIRLGNTIASPYVTYRKSTTVPYFNTDLNLSTSVQYQTATQWALAVAGTAPVYNGSGLANIGGTLSLTSPNGGISFLDQSLGTPMQSMFASGNYFNLYSPYAAHNHAQIDTIGRIGIGLVKGSFSIGYATAMLDIAPSNGVRYNGGLKLEAGKLVTTPEDGLIENDSTGKHIYWTSHAGVRYQLDQQGGAVNSVTNSDGTLTISPTTGAVVASLALGHANTWTGVQTQPAPIFTGTTSAGSTDSVLTINPSTGQVHWRYGTINLFFANGLTAAGGDSVYWGGTLNQSTTVNTNGFNLLFTGLANKSTIATTDSALMEDNTGRIYKAPIGEGSYTPTLTNTTNIASNGGGTATYTRTGHTIHVVLQGTLTPTAPATLSRLTFTLPFTTSNASQFYIGSGTYGDNSALTNNAGIVVMASTTTAYFSFIATTTGSGLFSFSFDYTL